MRNIELYEFFVEGEDSELSHVLLHITEPATAEEMEKGYFFAIVEINNGTLEQIEYTQKIIDTIEKEYYQTEEEEGKSAFEETLEVLNRKASQIIDSNSTTHSVFGVLRDNQISLSVHGSPHAVLFYKRDEKINNLNILEDSEDENQNQLFSSLIEGEINYGDSIFISTPHVTNYFSYDRLQKLLTTKKSKESVRHIQKVLHDMRDDLSFGGLIIHNAPPGMQPKTGKLPRSKQGSEESLKNLIDSERRTAETLSPPLFGNLIKKEGERKQKKIKRASTQKKAETNYRPRPDQPHQSLLNNVLVGLGRALVFAGQMLFLGIKKILLIFSRVFVVIFILITNKNNSRRAIIDSMRDRFFVIKKTISEMPLISKILFVVTVIFAIVFVVSIMILRVKENHEAETQAYKNTVQAVIDKKNAAEAALIYEDDEKAFDLLKEAKTLLSSIADEKKGEEIKNELKSELQVSLMRLRKMNVIEPELVANLIQTNPQAQTERLELLENSLIAYGKNDSSLYFVNTQTSGVEQKNHNSANLVAASTPKESDLTLFITETSDILEYSKESGAATSKAISYPGDVKISDGFIYNRRLYSLDTNNNQIYKHNPTQIGYDKGDAWLAENNDISDGVSLAIDGDVFVLKQSGKIAKFNKGSESEFVVSGLDPALDNPIKLWTYNDIPYIYILEPANKRIIVLNKEGKLIKQYTAVEWMTPSGMVVDSDHDLIYILDQNKIYKFSI